MLLPTMQVVTRDRPHRPVSLVSVSIWLRATSSSPAVPPDRRPGAPSPQGARGLGPCWVRTALGTAGPRRARAVTMGMQEPHVIRHLPFGPRPRKKHGAGFKSPAQLPRALRALAHEAVVTEDEPHRRVTVEPTTQPDPGLILGGRATSVPFTAVLTGPERTATDNHEASSTCAISHLAGDNSARFGFESRGSHHPG
jgi:hypothetical protein